MHHRSLFLRIVLFSPIVLERQCGSGQFGEAANGQGLDKDSRRRELCWVTTVVAAASRRYHGDDWPGMLLTNRVVCLSPYCPATVVPKPASALIASSTPLRILIKLVISLLTLAPLRSLTFHATPTVADGDSRTGDCYVTLLLMKMLHVSVMRSVLDLH